MGAEFSELSKEYTELKDPILPTFSALQANFWENAKNDVFGHWEEFQKAFFFFAGR